MLRDVRTKHDHVVRIAKLNREYPTIGLGEANALAATWRNIGYEATVEKKVTCCYMQVYLMLTHDDPPEACRAHVRRFYRAA